MNLERTKPETLAAAALDLTPSHFTAAHEYAERLNAALARLGLTDRLTLPPAPNTAIDELPAVVDVPLRKTLSVLMGKAQQGDASALATLEMAAQVMESIFAGLHARASVYPLALPSAKSLATLPQGVDALLPRKISNGAWSLLADGTPSDGIDDGMSLVRLLCSDAADSVTEICDDNYGWTMNAVNYACDMLATLFANLSKVTINCKKITRVPYEIDYWGVQVKPNYDIEYGEGVEGIYVAYPINKKPAIKDEFLLPCVKHIRPAEDMSTLSGNIGTPSITGKGVVRADELEDWCLGTYNSCAINGDELKSFIAPKLKIISRLYGDDANGFVNTCPQLIHLEFGEGFAGYYGWDGTSTPLQISSVNLKKWEATTALDASRTDLIEQGSTAENNLQQFLQNFKTYIAERLSEQGSGLTLTLSQAVRDAIQQDPEIVSIITSKGWTISPAPSV